MRILRRIMAAAIGVAAMAACAAPAAAATTQTQTITPNPWYRSDTFKGWGTSLAWYANATGHYALSDNAQAKQLANNFYDLLFGDNGLDLQTVRYNIGGGNASDTVDYLRPGAAVEGWWKANPEGEGHSDTLYGGTSTTYANKDKMLAQWNPDDDSQYNFDADQSQRWWLKKLTDDKQVANWELFSNSAPYFMTNSGYVSGHWKGSTDDQLAGDGTEAADSSTNATVKFAKYLARVTKYLKETYGITADTVEPLNEPNDCTNCWITQGSADKPTGRQEGMSVKSDQQTRLIKALREAMDKQGLTVTTDGKQRVSAMDASNSVNFQREFSGSINNGNGYLKNTENWDTELGQFNTHGYGDQTYAPWIRDVAKSTGKPLMMSEFEGDLGSGGFNPYSFDRALNFASQVNTQMRQYEPNAWVLWQPVEDYYNMEQDKAHGGENLNWGSIYIDFDCQVYTKENGDSVFASKRRVEKLYGGVNADGKVKNDVPACTTQTNSKFNVFKNYTHFIQAGDHVIATDSNDTTAAVRDSDKTLRLVVTNKSDSARATTVNLAGFQTIDANAVAKTYVTSAADKSGGDPTANTLVHNDAENAAVDAGKKNVTVNLPAKSVTTIVVSGVSGVSDDATRITDGGVYPLVNRSSGKALAVTDDGKLAAQQRSEDDDSQSFTFTAVNAPADRPADRAYVISTKDGKVLTAEAGDPSSGDASAVRLDDSLTVDTAKNDPSAIWILNSNDGAAFGLLNKKAMKTLDVDGASVVVRQSKDTDSQTWLTQDAPEDPNCPVVKAPWTANTLGASAGTFCQTSATVKDYGFTITDGANGGAWTSKNEYSTVYRADALKAGDSLTATVSSFDAGGNNDARVGIVSRNDLSTDGQNAAKGYAMLLLSKNGLFWQNDTDGNGYIDWETADANKVKDVTANSVADKPVTIRIARKDENTLEGFYRNGAGEFVSVGTVTIKSADDALDVGVLTEANNGKAGAKAAFTGVDLSRDKEPVTPPADTTAPVFKGVEDVTVDFGAAFDPLAGVTASDDVDGDVTAGIKVSGSVDTSKAGVYALTYTVSDKAGNTAEATRKVTVKEESKPQPEPSKPTPSKPTPAVPTPTAPKPNTSSDKADATKPGLSRTGSNAVAPLSVAIVLLLAGAVILRGVSRRR